MSSRSNRRPTSDPRPPQARMRGCTLQSTTPGARPVINTLLRRTRLEELLEVALPKYRQEHKGRPGKTTRYVRRVATRFDITTIIDELRIAEDAVCDGVFPLVTNVQELTPLEVLHAYKRQPDIEKRFSQLKNDFFVHPVHLKSVRRIQAILAVYFFVLLVKALRLGLGFVLSENHQKQLGSV